MRAIQAYRYVHSCTARWWETTGSTSVHMNEAKWNTGREWTSVQNGTRSRSSCQSKEGVTYDILKTPETDPDPAQLWDAISRKEHSEMLTWPKGSWVPRKLAEMAVTALRGRGKEAQPITVLKLPVWLGWRWVDGMVMDCHASLNYQGLRRQPLCQPRTGCPQTLAGSEPERWSALPA